MIGRLLFPNLVGTSAYVPLLCAPSLSLTAYSSYPSTISHPHLPRWLVDLQEFGAAYGGVMDPGFDIG
jgi:hypothetical protein